MMKIVLFAPTRKSAYSRIVANQIQAEPGIILSAIIVRSIWSLHRLRTELRRDGPRLLQKIRSKLVLDERALLEKPDKNNSKSDQTYVGHYFQQGSTLVIQDVLHRIIQFIFVANPDSQGATTDSIGCKVRIMEIGGKNIKSA